MHDIVRRPSRGVPLVPVVSSGIAPLTERSTSSIARPLNRSVPTVRRIVEQLIFIGSRASSLVARVTPPSDPITVLTPAKQTPTCAPLTTRPHRRQRALAKLTPKHLKEKVRGSATHIRQKSVRARGVLHTTTGKVIAANTIAVLALSGYTLANPTRAVESPAGASETVARRYLPSVAQVNTDVVAADPGTVAEQVAGSLPLAGWITPWNANDLAPYASRFQSLSAFWVTVAEDGIHVTPKGSWEPWQQYLAASGTTRPITFLTVSGDPDVTFLALANPVTQQAHIAELLQIVRDQQFDGIDIDYEALGSENRDLFTQFIRSLSDAFHAAGKQVAVTVEARLANAHPMDWFALCQYADELRIMAYDYHSQTTGEPGPVAPLGWLRELLDYTVQHADRSKVVLGIGNYGYDWTSPTQSGESWQGVGVSTAQAVQVAADHAVPITRTGGIDARGYDIGGIPTFTYQDSSGATHSVWFEDSTSISAKLSLAAPYRLRGIILWSVGSIDPNLWQSGTPTSP